MARMIHSHDCGKCLRMNELPMVMITPQPTVIMVGVEQFDQGKAVKVLVSLPTGTTVFYLSADSADEIAGNLKRNAQEARSLLVVGKVVGNGRME